MALNLPPELVAHIFSFLPGEYSFLGRTETLTACALVCRAWRPVAQHALLSHVDFMSEFLHENKRVTQLLKVIEGLGGGWKCEVLHLSGLELAQISSLLEAATSIRRLDFSHTYGHLITNKERTEPDLLGYQSLQGLKELELEGAEMAPTQAQLTELRSLSCGEECRSELALPSIIAAAPNLQTLDLFLEPPEFYETVSNINTAHLTKLKSLNLYLGADYEGMWIEPGLSPFIAGCSSQLKSLALGPFYPWDHVELVKAVKGHLVKLKTDILTETAGDASVGLALLKMAGAEATKELKKWRVLLPDLDDEDDAASGSESDPESDSEAEQAREVSLEEVGDEEVKEWKRVCEARGIEVKVFGNREDYLFGDE